MCTCQTKQIASMKPGTHVTKGSKAFFFIYRPIPLLSAAPAGYARCAMSANENWSNACLLAGKGTALAVLPGGVVSDVLACTTCACEEKQ